MYFLLSGEGPTDLGSSTDNQPATGEKDARVGPLALLVDQLVHSAANCSPLVDSRLEILSKRALSEMYALVRKPRKMSLPGKRSERETRYFYRNARMLAAIALERQYSLKEDVVAILFRDADGTASGDRGERDAKYQSMRNGFRDESFVRGVPMIPKPKSEAWIICALRKPKYRNCGPLEDESGSDNSPNSLKKQLANLCSGQFPTSDQLRDWVLEGEIDPHKIRMPSFDQFKADLLSALE